jgi:hypothetical protein
MSYTVIKEYYKRAWAALQNRQPELAKEILHEQMPVTLYDMSLDILYNYNMVFSDDELRGLINAVDKVLNSDVSIDDIDSSFLNDTNLIF